MTVPVLRVIRRPSCRSLIWTADAPSRQKQAALWQTADPLTGPMRIAPPLFPGRTITAP